MATPPFDILEAKPADADIVSQHPADERAMRDILESWMNIDHDSATGHHAIGVGNDATRDATTDWVVGSFWLNTSTTPARLEHVVSVGPVVWAETVGGLDTPAGDVRYLLLTGGTVTGALRLSGTSPDFELEETDRTIEVDGLWRFTLTNGQIVWVRNTAVAGDFSTEQTVLRFDESLFEYVGNEVWHAGNDGAGSGLDADTVDGEQASALHALANATGTISTAQHGNLSGGAQKHANATGANPGFMSAAQKTKLDGIETSADVNPSAAEILTSIKTVDGAGSGLDADLMDGIDMSTAANKSHLDQGFQKFPGGLIMNWGSQSVAANTTVNVTLPKAYASNHFQCVQSPGTALNTGTNESNGACIPISLTQLSIQNINDVANIIRWFSIGL